MDIELTNLPEDGDKVDMRMLALGGGISGKITYLMEIGETEDGEIVASFTLSNAPAVATPQEALDQHIEMVAGMLEALQDALETDPAGDADD